MRERLPVRISVVVHCCEQVDRGNAGECFGDADAFGLQLPHRLATAKAKIGLRHFRLPRISADRLQSRITAVIAFFGAVPFQHGEFRHVDRALLRDSGTLAKK